MSDKIPISLHNSDLFLKPEFTNTDKKDISTDNLKKDIFKKGPTLGENNQLARLHKSYLLPPLHSSTYISKAVTSCLLTKQEFVTKDKGLKGVQKQDHNQNSQNYKKSSATRANQRFASKAKRSLATLPAAASGLDKDMPALRYSLGSGLTPYIKAQVELQKKDSVRPESRLIEKTEHSPLNKKTGKLDLVPFNDQIDSNNTKSLSGLSFLFLNRLKKGVRSSISREFLLVTTNFVLFSVLAIAQRSHYGKSSLLTNGKSSHTTLCGSKMSNTTPSYFSRAGVSRHLHGIKTGYLTPLSKQIVGVFLEKPNTSVYRTENTDTKNKTETIKGKKLSFFFCPKSQGAVPFDLKRLSTNSPKKSTYFVENLIQPWSCIKACHTVNNKIAATRSLLQVDNNVALDNDSQIQAFQYYLPFYKSKERLFIETDTIPAKRDTIYSQKTKDLNTSRKLESSSYISVSEFVLKRCFYKYGLLLGFASKEASESHAFEEKDPNDLIRSQLQNDTGENFGLTESRDRIVDDMNSYKSSCTPAIYMSQNELDHRATVPQNVIKVKNGYVLLTKRYPTRLLPARMQKHSLYVRAKTDAEVAPTIKILDSRFNTLRKTERNNPFLISHKRNDKQNGCYNRFASTILKVLLPVVSEPCLNRYTFALNEVEDFKHSHKKQNRKNNQLFFPSGSIWSQYNLSKLRFADLVSVQKNVPIFTFMPDRFVKNTSVSGYQFPELQDKEIAYLFRKRVVFHFYLNDKRSSNRAFFGNLFTQITTPFRTLRGGDLMTQVISTPFFINDNGVVVCQVRTKNSSSNALLTNQLLGFANAKLKVLQSKAPTVSSFETDGVKMQYTQVDLDEIKNISDVFQKLGRDYEDYLRQPKDSLPALVISPSLEDDWEIEEEGIRIFRKRDFIKNKKNNLQDKNGEPIAKAELWHHIDSASPLLNTTSELQENKNLSSKAASKSEMQNHQLLVKNALRQAQEEIDSIAKKEEKGTEKDKQVIPPLTRLEALYTIRNRERKREQAKDFTLDKSVLSSLRSNKAKLSSRNGIRVGSVVSESKGECKTKFCNAKHTPLPIFEKLFLYSDKPSNHSLNQDRDTYVCPKQSFVFEDLYAIAKPSFALPCMPKFASSAKQVRSTRGFTPWLFSKFGQDTLCTDRKHSFFGEMSLPSQKLTAQEQKQIFQQKANPLLKVQTKNTVFESVSQLSVEKGLKVDDHNLDFHSVSGTIPLSLLSQFSALKKADYKKTQAPQLKVGAVKADLLPSSTWRSGSVLQTHNQYPNSSSVMLSKIPLDKTDTGHVNSLPEPFISKNRIYFYNNLSQNKACQGSAPKIKGTPLQSPVAHRVWQPKRMEPSTFRVSQRMKDTPVLPRITQKDWKNIMEWQLKKHFVEEDKRLLPLSFDKRTLATNKNKQLKIKKINLYLPWICIKKAPDSLNTSAWSTPSQPFSTWPLTRLDLTKNPEQSINCIPSFLQHRKFASKHQTDTSLKPNNGKNLTDSISIFSLSHQGSDNFYKTTPYWQLPTQQSLYTLRSPLKRQTNRSLIPPDRNAQRSSSLRTILAKAPTTNYDNRVSLPKKKRGISKKVFNESILFESVTKYSWLFIYTFVFVLMFKQLFTFVYKVGLKDFFINFLNSDFGRTITSEEFRYSVQNSPLTEFYRPTKRLGEFFGLERNKVQLLEIVWFLRNNCQGRNGPRGILLVGPPGVESVSVVQAIAGEANLPIIVHSLEKIAQDAEPQRQLEQLYMRAQKQAPCVLFLDQLDSVGARRDQLFTDNGDSLISSSSGQNRQVMASLFSETSLNSHVSGSVLNVSPEAYLFSGDTHNNNTISSNPFQKNQSVLGVEDQSTTLKQDVTNTVSPGNKLNVMLRLLTILDGITQSSGVVTVATARDLTKLDPALLRPKRFDRRIYLSLPNQQDRVHLFKIETQSIGHVKEMPWNYLSLQTESMSAADIKSAINYSLFRAVLKNSVHTVETLEYGISCVKTLTDKRVEKNKNHRESVSQFQSQSTSVSENINTTREK